MLQSGWANAQATGIDYSQGVVSESGFTERQCDRLRKLVAQAEEIHSCLGNLNERMFGPQPMAGASKGEMTAPAMGRAEQMDQLINDLGSYLGRIADEARRANNGI